MKKSIINFAVIAFTLLGGVAQADPIFNYSVTATPSSFSGLGGGSSVSLAGGSDSSSSLNAGGAGTNINLFTVNITSGSTTNTVNTSANFALNITDVASGKTGTVNLTGAWTGTLGGINGSNMMLALSPPSPVSTQIDGFLYSVSYLAPNLNASGPNTFAVHVTATAVAAIPEPTSIVAFGLIVAGGIGYRTWRKRQMA